MKLTNTNISFLEIFLRNLISLKISINIFKLVLLLSILSSICSIYGQNNFNKEKDLFIAQFDNYPDSDDIHSQAAVGSFLAHPDFEDVNYLGVAGSYGNQPSNSNWQYIDSNSLFEIAFGEENIDWIDARADRVANDDYTYSADFIANRVKPILEEGGKVWVMEAGQSNITADWIATLIADGVTNVKTNVIVVQHSVWNENQTNSADLTYVKNNANFVQIDDGNRPYGTGSNRGDNTPDYQEDSTEFISQIIATDNPNDFTRTMWIHANDLALNSTYRNGPIPSGGIDFSDTSEAMWIFDLNDEIRTVQNFIDEFITLEETSSCEIYEEEDGIVIIEAENRTSDLGEWNIETRTLNNSFTGSGYLEFNGNSVVSGKPNSPIEYQFKINEPGLYELHLRGARETVTLNGEERTDVANDCFVRVEGDYGAGPNVGNEHGDDAPLTTLMTDTKFFGGNDNSFVWADGNRLDLGGERNKRNAIYDFKAGETYTLIVSGRSKLFKLDRIMFRKISVNEGGAESLDNKETFADDCNPDSDVENVAPTVAIDRPLNNTLYLEGVDIEFNANALDSDGTIEQVQFFVDGNLLATERVIHYTATMSGFDVGSYTVTAIATDNDGASTTSETVVVHIESEVEENIAPTVAIDTPANNASFIEGVDIDFNANASDDDGNISQVQFFVDGTLLKTERVLPYTATMSGFGAGSYTVTAIATDNEGASTTSDSITVIIKEEEAPIMAVVSSVQDAYLQGTRRFNSEIVRVEDGNRTGFLMFVEVLYETALKLDGFDQLKNVRQSLGARNAIG